MKMTLRFLSKSFLLAAVGAMALSSQAWSQVGFRATGIHGGAEPNNAANNIIVYNLPTTGIYAGPANASFNVLAQVQGGGSVNAAGYGVIMNLPAGSPLSFNITTLPESGSPNNIPNSTVNPHGGLSIILGDTSVPGQPVGQPSLGVVGLHPTAGADVTVNNGHGLFNVPFQVAAGATGTFTLGMSLGGNDFSGFATSAGQVLTNPNGFPNANQTIIVRQSVRGDMSGDGLTNFADIGAFVNVVSNGVAPYQNANPWLRVAYVSDMTGNGATDFADIGGFVAAISGGGSPAAVPEPSTVAMLCMAGIGLGVAAYRRRNASK